MFSSWELIFNTCPYSFLEVVSSEIISSAAAIILPELNLSKSSLANLRSSIRKKMALNRGQSLTNSILCF